MTNEKRDLILRALVKFEGKWPDGYTALIVSTDSNARWGAGVYQDFPHGIDRFDDVMKGNQSWLWVCDQSEFEAVLQELADQAPEGAEYYSPESEDEWSAWWKKDDDEVLCISDDAGICTWGGGCFDGTVKLIPLHNREPEKWMPEVGQECEAAWGSKITWHKFVIAGEFGFVLIGDYWQRKKVFDFDDIEFRPLRTEAEIERERLYDEIYALDAGMDDYQINRVVEFIQGRDND